MTTPLTDAQLRKLGITRRQLKALRAVAASPDSSASIMFWAEASAYWRSWRKTLGSLHARGLVAYPLWEITDAGRELLARVDSLG